MKNILVSFLSVHLHQTLVKVKGRTIGDIEQDQRKKTKLVLLSSKPAPLFAPFWLCKLQYLSSQYQRQQKKVGFFTTHGGPALCNLKLTHFLSVVFSKPPSLR
jgi:hypothetical protein